MDDVVREEFRQHALHHGAVLDHVRDAARHPQVVLQNVELAVGVPHQIGAANVRPDAVRRADAGAAGTVFAGFQHVLFRDHAIAQHPPVVVDVVDEGVERPHALLEPARDLVPLRLQDQARHDVERPLAVDVGAVVVDGEGDAHGADGEFGRGLAFADLVVRESGERLEQTVSAGSRLAVDGDELVPEIVGAVGLPVDGHPNAGQVGM